MDMKSACAQILHEVDGSLGCIVIDMQTGLTVAAECRPGRAMNPTTINLVSVVSTNLFCGKLIRQFEAALGKTEGPKAGYVREVQMTTGNTNQFMAAIPGWEHGLFVLVTDKNVSLGLGWMAVHQGIQRLGQAPRPATEAAQPAPAQNWQSAPSLPQSRFDAEPTEPPPEEAAPMPAGIAEPREAYARNDPAPSPQSKPPPELRAAEARAGGALPAAAEPERNAPSSGRAPPRRAAPVEAKTHRAAPAETRRRRTYREAAHEAAHEEPPPAAAKAASEANEETENSPKPAALGPRMNMFTPRRRKGGKGNK